MKRHVVRCFEENRGIRGVTFYDRYQSSFLPWKEVFEFMKKLPQGKTSTDEFVEQLTDTLANYDPETEFLAVFQEENIISVELFSQVK